MVLGGLLHGILRRAAVGRHDKARVACWHRLVGVEKAVDMLNMSAVVTFEPLQTVAAE